MTSLIWLHDPAFKLYAICAVILVVKMYGVGVFTVITRGRTNTTLNREDAPLLKRQLQDQEHPDVARVLRAHRNDLENIPAFLALGLIAVLAGIPLLGAQICFIAFTVGRVLHTFMYLNALQPWRTLSFGVAALSNLALGVMILIRVLG